MKIFYWNPKTKQVFLPIEMVTILGIETFESAKSLISDPSFNPANYYYIVKSKNGKPHYFSAENDAKDFALKKSTKTTCYSVYSNGNVVASFMNKKELSIWNLVKEEKLAHHLGTVTNFLKQSNRRNGRCTIGGSEPVSIKIEACDGKVRYVKTYMQYIRLKNNYVVTNFSNSTIVFHANGNVYKTSHGKLEHKSASSLYVLCSDEMLNVLKEQLSKLRPELKSILKLANKLNICGMFSRPTVFFKFDTFHKKAVARKEQLYFGNYPREIVDESKLIGVLAKRMHAPMTKGLRKMYCCNAHNLEIASFLSRVGFKDVNSYAKLAGVATFFMHMNPENAKPFFSAVIKYRGENQAVKMFYDTDARLIIDTYQMYKMIDEDMSAFIIKNARNIEEIHDTFNVCGHREVYEDRKIAYTKEEKNRFEFDCDGVSFRLAEGAKDLAIIGAKMGICVGGYADQAIRKATIIIKAMKGNEHIACIEFRNCEIQQIKAKFNNPMKAEYKKPLDAWLQRGKIPCECHDYKNIGNPWRSSCNYAAIDPNRFIPANHDGTLQIIRAEHNKETYTQGWLKAESSVESYNYWKEFGNPIERFHVQEFTPVEDDELPFEDNDELFDMPF